MLMEGSGSLLASTLPGVPMRGPRRWGLLSISWTCTDRGTPHKEPPEMDQFTELRVWSWCRRLGRRERAR